MVSPQICTYCHKSICDDLCGFVDIQSAAVNESSSARLWVSGKLPITLYSNENVLPDFTDYSMIDGTTMNSIRDKVEFYEFEFDVVKSRADGQFVIRFGNSTNNTKFRLYYYYVEFGI